MGTHVPEHRRCAVPAALQRLRERRTVAFLAGLTPPLDYRLSADRCLPLAGMQALDTVLSATTLGATPTVHRFIGSHASPIDYLPIIYPVPSTNTPPPPPAPKPPPAPPGHKGTLVHGNSSVNEMEDGVRLWCGGLPGDKCGGAGGKLKTFPCPSAAECQAACLSNATCLGVTWVHPGTLGPTAACYMLGSLDSQDPEVGFSSWSRIPVVAKPHSGPAPPPPSTGPIFAPDAGRSSNAVLPYFAVFGQTAGSVYSIGWSGGWEGEVSLTEGQAGAVNVRVSHGPPGVAGTLCASLNPGEAIRSMRIIAVPFSKAEAPPAATTTGYMYKAPQTSTEAAEAPQATTLPAALAANQATRQP